MRLQVESELEMATGEIESLTKKIELGASPPQPGLKQLIHDAPEASRGRRRKNGAPMNRRKIIQAPLVEVRFRVDSDDRNRGLWGR
jgi:large subunit ribosomal protein L17e